MEVFGGIARACAMAGAAATWVANPEIYPTDIRATGHSTCNAMARIGALMSPFIVMSELSVPAVGVVLCVTSLLTATAAGFTRETLNKELDSSGGISTSRSQPIVRDHDRDVK